MMEGEEGRKGSEDHSKTSRVLFTACDMYLPDA